MEEKVQVEHRLHYCLTFLGNIHQLLSLGASLSNWVPANFQGNVMNHNHHHSHILIPGESPLTPCILHSPTPTPLLIFERQPPPLDRFLSLSSLPL